MSIFNKVFTILVPFFAFLLVIIANVIYFSKIIPTLNKYGKEGNYQLLPTKQWKQIYIYKRICSENNLPIWHSNFMLVYPSYFFF